MVGCAEAEIAARFRGDLVLNGYSDWYLPSRNELKELKINKIAIGGFANNNYWSSSESSGSFTFEAWSLSFSDDSQFLLFKGVVCNVRAVRTF